MISNKIKLILLRSFVVAIPSYTVAYLTEKVTLVVPTLAMFLLIANSIESGSVSNRNRIEEDGSSLMTVIRRWITWRNRWRNIVPKIMMSSFFKSLIIKNPKYLILKLILSLFRLF